MDNSFYQNIDVPNSNPLNTETPTHSSPIAPKKNNWLKDPKIIALIIMGAVVVVLLIISLFVNAAKSISKMSLSSNKVTPTPASAISPVIENKIPPQFVEKFNTIDKHLNTKEDFLPPDIDLDLGIH